MNSSAPIDPSLIDVTLPDSGYPDSVSGEDTRDQMMSAVGDTVARDFPDALWIEPSDWADAERDCEKYKTFPIHYTDRYTHQDPTHECTSHSLVCGIEVARNLARGKIYGGPQVEQRLPESAEFDSVWLSPLSVYAEANPNQWGGASCRQVLEIACRRGVLPDKIQPRDYGFKHSLHGTVGKGGVNQSRGPWTPVSRFPEGWKETAAGFIVKEVIFPESWEQIVCLVYRGRVVNVGRKGHAIPYTHVRQAEKLLGYKDSYSIIRWDSFQTVRSAVSGASSISTVTIPDDWSNPAA